MSTAFEEYLAIEQMHAEFLDEQVLVNPPSRRHIRMSRYLTRVLEDACPEDYEVLPEAGWRAGLRTVLEPDVMVAAKDAPSTDILTVAPLLVVEVVSPSSKGRDWGRKRELYLAAGVHYWIVDDDGLWIVGQRAELLPGGVQHLNEPFPVSINIDALLAL
jgi:Uma2 family endonuclease